MVEDRENETVTLALGDSLIVRESDVVELHVRDESSENDCVDVIEAVTESDWDSSSLSEPDIVKSEENVFDSLADPEYVSSRLRDVVGLKLPV